MRRAIVRLGWAFTLALTSGCAPARSAAPKPPGRYVEHVQSGGTDRTYILHVPPGYDGTKPIPVVVVLHGWTASARLAEVYTRMAEEGDAKGFASVFPDGAGKQGGQGWNAGFINLSGMPQLDDVAFVSIVLDQMERELSVDRSREYVCGHSNGAFMANLIGSRLSNRLAAIGSVAGSIGTAGGQTIPDPIGPVSVILIHGKEDSMVAYGPESHALFRGVGAQASAKWWAEKDGCSLVPQETSAGNGNVVTDLFKGGRSGTEVELVTINNGSHSWPGGYFYDLNHRPAIESTTGVNAADQIWSFFETHPRSG